MVFDSIETFVSFSSIWYVCVATGCRMTMWQVKCAQWKSRNATMEGCATIQISSVVFGFQLHRGCGSLVFRSLFRMKVHENPLRNVLKEARFLSKGWY